MAGRNAQVRLIICRHTQTNDNIERRHTGQNNVELNETGFEQARQLAEKIAGSFHVHGVLSSDLGRTCTVAKEISFECSSFMLLELTPELREVHAGRMSGLTKAESLVQFPDEKYRSNNAFYDYRDIGGESSDDVASRYVRAIDDEAFRLTSLYPDQPITLVIVGHGIALRTVFVDRLHIFRHLHKQGDFQVCDWFISQL